MLASLCLLPIQAEASNSGVIQFDAEVSIQAADSGGEGVAPKPSAVNIVAYNGGPLMLANYDAPVYLDLDGLKGLGQSIPLLRDHDKKRIVGQITAERTGNRIEASGRLVGSSEDRREIEDLARDGFNWQASVGARPVKLRKIKAGEPFKINGRAAVGPAYVAVEANLVETSVVTIGSDRGGTRVDLQIAATDPDDDTVDLDDPGAGGSGLTRMKIERDRRKKIEAAAMRLIQDGGDIDAIEAAMTDSINAGDSPDAFELKILRQVKRPQGRISAGGGNELRGRDLEQAVEASLLLTLGSTASDLERHYPERVLNAMDHHVELRGGLGLQDAMLFACEQNGMRASRRDIRAMMTGAFPSIQASGISTFSLSGIFSNIANKSMRESFLAVEQAWRQIAEIEPVRDFKEISFYTLTGDMIYEKVSPTGELKHATVGEQTYTNQADTYGKMFSLTRQDQINDDLGALRRIPRMLGRGAGLKINDVFWTEFQENAGGFFAAGNSNVSGTGSPAWYLMADPMDLAMIQIVFLNGRDVPFVEQADADFNQLGVQFRGYHDFGVNKQEPRAAVRMGSALTLDTLGTAEQLFLDQTDYDGHPLAIMPKILLVHTGNKGAAEDLMNATQLQSGNTGKVMNYNRFNGRFTPVVSAYLSNANVS